MTGALPKRKVVSGSRVTLPVNFACKPELSFNPLARVTLAVGLPYLLVNRVLISCVWNSPDVEPFPVSRPGFKAVGGRRLTFQARIETA